MPETVYFNVIIQKKVISFPSHAIPSNSNPTRCVLGKAHNYKRCIQRILDLTKAILPQADVMTFHGSAVVYYSVA